MRKLLLLSTILPVLMAGPVMADQLGLAVTVPDTCTMSVTAGATPDLMFQGTSQTVGSADFECNDIDGAALVIRSENLGFLSTDGPLIAYSSELVGWVSRGSASLFSIAPHTFSSLVGGHVGVDIDINIVSPQDIGSGTYGDTLYVELNPL